ncbi:heat-shock protein Hsp70 [Thermotoga sp. 38H-to]|nr:heat-shock protein Hsp70 [Thermotoga sp. 38H-to]
MIFVFLVSYHNYQVALEKHNQLMSKYQELKTNIEEQKVLNQKLLEVIENEKLRGHNLTQTGQKAGGEGERTR